MAIVFYNLSKSVWYSIIVFNLQSSNDNVLNLLQTFLHFSCKFDDRRPNQKICYHSNSQIDNKIDVFQIIIVVIGNLVTLGRLLPLS